MLDGFNWVGGVVPGPGDVASIEARPDLTGFVTLTLPGALTLDVLAHSHFAQHTIDGPGTLTLASGQLIFTDAITSSPGIALNTLFIRSPLAGTGGLTKAGPGFVALTGANTYIGATTISSDGGITIDSDARLGPSFNNLQLEGGALRITSPVSSIRPMFVGLAGGRLEAFADATLAGTITGPGSLNLARGGVVTFEGTSFHTGPLRILDNSTLRLISTSNSTSSIDVAGTLEVGALAIASNLNRIGDFTPISLRGGVLRLIPTFVNTNETVGSTTLRAGTNRIEVGSNSTSTSQLTLQSLVRADRSTLQVVGRDLGFPAINRATLSVLSPSGITSIGAGGPTSAAIVPWMFGNASATPSTAAGVVEAGLVTLSGSTFRLLGASDYATSFAVAGQNVRITDSNLTLFSAATVNALVLRDTASSSIPTGIEGSALTVTSGAIVAVADSAGDELYIDSALAFGTAEAVIHTAPAVVGHANLTVRGAISGTSGLTKSGGGSLRLESASSTISGPVTVNGGDLVVVGSVGLAQPGPLGSSFDSVVINAGAGSDYVALRVATPLSTFARNLVVRQSADSGDNALLGTAGGFGTTFTGTIRIDGGFLNLEGDTEPEPLTLSGVISGPGGLQEPRVESPLAQRLRINGNNTYAGGTVIRAGTWLVNSDTALGTGPIYFEGPGRLEAAVGPQTLGNAIVLRASPTLAGIELAGSVDLGSVQRTLNIIDAVELTGVVSRGGITKAGVGTLRLSGNNTYNGQTLVSAGRLIVASDHALGVASGARQQQATILTGSAVVELTGSITTPEAFYFGEDAQPISSTSPTGNLRSSSGTNVIANVVAVDAVGSIGVDAGATLAITGDLLDRTTNGTGTLRKVGSGTLTVNSVRLPSLDISAGRVSLAAGGDGASRVTSLSIAAGASVDLADHAIVIDYTGASVLGSVLAILDTRLLTTAPGLMLGYAEASVLFDTFPASYDGQLVDATSLIVAATYAGDFDLDRTVGFADLLTLAQNYETSGAFWWQGDVDRDGTVGFADLLALAQNYGAGSIVADWAVARALVPEPGVLSLVALMGVGLRRAR
jgi:autotransporter-associated beta strand protein